MAQAMRQGPAVNREYLMTQVGVATSAQFGYIYTRTLISHWEKFRGKTEDFEGNLANSRLER